ncbi:MAG TPA: YidC/Oxa1 family membrane protein insertase [Acidimicrobiia bacterium]|nr:YidC/Oxa1 family membrane protein insertase [Acidimicrobiia bacterium]
MHIPILAAGSSVLDPLYNALGAVLAFFYSLIPNLGVAIILMTCAVMLVLYPLTAKQAKSMLAMQRVQPEIKKLQAKYKGDRQKLNEEVMKFYQENKINPLAGCLPLVVQLPIFFTLYRVLRDPYKHIPKTGSFAGLYHAFCDHAINVAHKACSPSTLTHLKFIGIDLQKTATDSHGSVFAAIPFFVLVGLVVFTGYLQTKQAQSRTPQTNKQMGTIMKILPVFFGLISLSFPAGLVLYFLISNVWRVGQQEVIFRRIGSPTSPAAGKLGTGARPADPIDVTSTDHDDDEVTEIPEAKEPPAPRRPAPRRPAAPEPGPAHTPVPQREQSRGLRGFFQLPPPPEGNGGGRPPGTTRPSAPGPARGSGAKPGGAAARRPPPQRRRGSKKKRKR